MDRDNFYKKLEERLDIDLLNVPSLYSKLNMFFDACDMDLRNGKLSDSIQYDWDIKECVKEYKNEKLDYKLNICFVNENNEMILFLNGHYNDLTFKFDNYYNQSIYDNKIYEIPYVLRLEKVFNERDYVLEIENIDKRKTKFSLARSYDNNKEIYEKSTFYSNRIDFENVYGIIKSFVNNPDYVFEAYKSVMNNKEINFTSDEIDSAKKTDKLLVTENGKLLKKMKKDQK